MNLAARCTAAVLLTALGCGDVDGHAEPPEVVRDASVDGQDGGQDVQVPGCEPTTCAEQGAECGSIPDECGDKLACGGCPAGATCGGGGPNRCGSNACAPRTCMQLGATCGYVSDGCSEAIDCGVCAAPLTCGGGGIANQCGCKPKSCTAIGANCGTAPDGCGGIVDCGACEQGATCGGGGANRCGGGSCTAKTCAQLSASCGITSDQCSKALDCGGCTSPDVCGGEGVQNQCGCPGKTCAQLGAACGTIANGCGYDINCGTCPAGIVCGGAGVPHQCGCNCVLPHATGVCVDAGCGVASCEAGWGDCDQDSGNGCETDLQTAAQHCGTCGNSCDDGNACTVGDSCQAGQCVPGAVKACGSPPNTQCYVATGTCNPSTGSCAYDMKPNGTECAATTCFSWGACDWADPCDNAATRKRECTDHKCASGQCQASNRTESDGCSRTVANGTSCAGGYCCSNSCVPRNSKAHCGSCGVNCGANACVQITGLNQFSCTCASNAYCQGAGFGAAATCYSASGQSLCNCQCPSGTSCTGQCAGGGTCADIPGHNYCHY